MANRIKPINGKAKGSRYENTIAKDFTSLTNVLWDRTFRSGGGAEKGDIHPVGSLSQYCVEIKNRQSWSIDDLFHGKGEVIDWWMKLCKEARDGKQLPMLVCKRNRLPAVAVLRHDSKIYAWLLSSGHLADQATLLNLDRGYVVLPYAALLTVDPSLIMVD